MAIQDIAVVGAGTMGPGIAQLAASVNVNVVLINVDDAAIRKGLAAIRSGLDGSVANC